jgi:hypothetical protein
MQGARWATALAAEGGVVSGQVLAGNPRGAGDGEVRGRRGEALALVAGEPRLGGAVLDPNLMGEMAFPVADALRDRGVPFVFATGYDAHAVPPRFARVRHCEKSVDPLLVVEGSGDRVAADA